MIHENSRESYQDEKLRGNPDIFKQRIYNLLIKESRPLTDREIFTILNESDVNNIRPEITRMIQVGKLFEVDRVRCKTTGKKVRRTSFKKNHEELF